MTKATIDSHSVSGDSHGIEYLRRLEWKEADVLFDRARMMKKVDFEDDQRRNYTMTYEGGVYQVTKRGGGAGWF